MTISDAQFAEWLKRDAARVVLCELAFAYESGGDVAEGTIYLSDRAYKTEASDTPANVSYHAAMRAAPRFRRSIDRATLGGRAELSISDLAIINLDGAFDFLLEKIIDGYEARFYLGAPQGTPGWSRSDFRLAFVAVAESVYAPSDEEITVRLKDKRLLLDREVMGDPVGGSGPESTHYLPLLWGSHFNVEAKIYDAVALQYAVLSNYASALSYDVRDSGLSLAEPDVAVMALSTPLLTVNAGTEVFTKSAHGMSVNDVVLFTENPGGGGTDATFAPFAGMTSGVQYWVASVPTADTFTLSATKGGAAINVTGTTYLGNTGVGYTAKMRVRRWYDDLSNTGRIELSSTPDGRVTVDLLATTTYTQAPYAFAKYLIETYGNVVAADIDSAAFTAADTALDAKIALGYVNYSVPTRANLIDVLDALIGSAFGWYGINKDGEITCGLVDVSGIASATAARELGSSDVIAASGLSVENEPVSAGRINVEYEINHTLQTDGLAAAVDVEARRTFAVRYQKTQRSSAPTGTAYSTNKPLYHKTMVEAEPRQAAEMSSFRYGSDTALPIGNYANEVAADLAPQRQFVEAPVGLDFYATELGDVVEITYPRFGLDAGVNARVIGIEVDLTAEEIALQMVRQFTPDITTASHP